MKELQVKTWYKNRTKKDQIDYEISQYLKENEYDRVVEIYENKLEVFTKNKEKKKNRIYDRNRIPYLCIRDRDHQSAPSVKKNLRRGKPRIAAKAGAFSQRGYFRELYGSV